MGACRFLYNNLITSAEMITVGTVANGAIGFAIKEGEGTAVATSGGTYVGDDDFKYTVEIDDVSGGYEIGLATFRWKKNTSVGWEATGVATASTFIVLDNGVQIKWTAAAGNDFALGDKWYVIAKAPYGKPCLLDHDRDSAYRSSGLTSPETITIDLGSAQTAKAIVLLDHNFTSGATITLKANSSDSWAAPAYSQALTHNSDIIVYYMNQTYRYWRIEVTDAGNQDGYISMSELFLGTYFEPSLFYSFGPYKKKKAFETVKELPSGVRSYQMHNRQTLLNLEFTTAILTDVTGFETLFDAVKDTSALVSRPCFVNLNTDAPNNTVYADIDGELDPDWYSPNSYMVTIKAQERLSSRV